MLRQKTFFASLEAKEEASSSSAAVETIPPDNQTPPVLDETSSPDPA
ncbi:hypothetical protein N9933_02890 [bacterium]|nr:hypothetical protein [bacterium]